MKIKLLDIPETFDPKYIDIEKQLRQRKWNGHKFGVLLLSLSINDLTCKETPESNERGYKQMGKLSSILQDNINEWQIYYIYQSARNALYDLQKDRLLAYKDFSAGCNFLNEIINKMAVNSLIMFDENTIPDPEIRKRVQEILYEKPEQMAERAKCAVNDYIIDGLKRRNALNAIYMILANFFNMPEIMYLCGGGTIFQTAIDNYRDNRAKLLSEPRTIFKAGYFCNMRIDEILPEINPEKADLDMAAVRQVYNAFTDEASTFDNLQRCGDWVTTIKLKPTPADPASRYSLTDRFLKSE